MLHVRQAMAVLCCLLLSTAVMAAGNPLSVHVLNLETGLPSPGVSVQLDARDGDVWKPLARGVTNDQGRISALFPADRELSRGIYRVTFETGAYFRARDVSTFFPEVPVVFEVSGDVTHTHIPLLLSRYGFSTYRGN